MTASSVSKKTFEPLQENQLISTAQAAQYLGVKQGTLRNDRVYGKFGIPYYRIGNMVRYKVSELDAFIESRKVLTRPAANDN